MLLVGGCRGTAEFTQAFTAVHVSNLTASTILVVNQHRSTAPAPRAHCNDCSAWTNAKDTSARTSHVLPPKLHAKGPFGLAFLLG